MRGEDGVSLTSTMNREEQYFVWLKSQVGIEYNRETSRTYDDLLNRLNAKEFVWIIPNDDNRVEDGLDLRSEFLGGAHYDVLQQGVSILEVLVGLSRRLAFNADGDPKLWAWRMIENVDLHKFSDPIRPKDEEPIDIILENLIWRQFSRDGMGSFFPLAYAKEDQTKIEIWYQMNAYINENVEF